MGRHLLCSPVSTMALCAAAAALMLPAGAAAAAPSRPAVSVPATDVRDSAAYERAVVIALLFSDSRATSALRSVVLPAQSQPAQAPPAGASPRPPGFELQPTAPSAPGPAVPAPVGSTNPGAFPAAGLPMGPVAPVTLPPLQPGALLCPIAGPVRHSDDWGAPRSGGRRHQGNDVFAATGTPVVAMDDAVIRAVDAVDEYDGSGQGDLGGRWVSYITVSGDRWYHSHLASVEAALQPGTVVRRGQQLGTVGNSGNARTTPPHNHVEYRPGGGEKVNPYPLLRQLCS